MLPGIYHKGGKPLLRLIVDVVIFSLVSLMFVARRRLG